MKPTQQTLFTNREATPPVYGNCLQACVASLLELDIKSIPHFVTNDSYPLNLHKWLNERGLVGLYAVFDGTSKWWGHHLIFGPSPRAGLHAVVGLNGKPVFDPHPDNQMLKPGTEPEWKYFFILPKVCQ